MRCCIISKRKLDKKIDITDIRIIDLMVSNKNNKEISKTLKIPLSTVQRRVRDLTSAEYIFSKVEVNPQKLGFKTGLVHVYLSDGHIEELSKKIHNLDHIQSVEIHIGNSDILGQVVYKEGKDLLNLISAIKKMEGVDRIVWSERIDQSPSKGMEIMSNVLNGQMNQFK
jgi:Lrp/AsnC family transcriptional regulator, regulator for asnA, asnC and gidA